MSPDQRRKNRFNLTIGHQRAGGNMIHGKVDEIRFSDVVRYTSANNFSHWSAELFSFNAFLNSYEKRGQNFILTSGQEAKIWDTQVVPDRGIPEIHPNFTF